MKAFIFATILLLTGCVAEQTEVPPASAPERRFEPATVAPEELSRVKAICDALQVKEERLPAMVSSKFTFSYSEKGCEDADLDEPKNVVVSLQKPDSHYVFVKETGDSFPFSAVETSDEGVMETICSNLASLSNPLQTSSKGAIWFTTFGRSTECASDFNSMCIYLQKGENTSDSNYSIHTEEWIKFKLRDEKVGFFTERKLVSAANCAPGKSIIKKAVLK